MKNNIIAQSLGITPTTQEKQEVELYEKKEVSDTLADADFHEARRQILDTIDKTNTAVEEAIEIAQQSQHHLAYQSLNALLQTNLKAARDLISLQKELRETKKMQAAMANTEAQQVTNAQTNVFIGTTADMLRMIESAREKLKNDSSE